MAFRYKTTKICVVCGKEFRPTRREYTTCSKVCGCKIRAGKTRTLPDPGLKCAYCGRPIDPSKANKNRLKFKNRYCGQECYWLHKKDLQRGANNTKWKGGKPKQICPICGKEFFAYAKRHYCSRKCSYRGQKTVNLYTKGRTYEWDVKKRLQKDGYIVVRSSGSHSPFDLVAVNEKEIILIQCKRSRVFSAPDKREMETFKKILVPPCCRKEFRVKLDFKPEQIFNC